MRFLMIITGVLLLLGTAAAPAQPAAADTVQARAYLEKGRLFLQEIQYDSARYYCESAIRAYRHAAENGADPAWGSYFLSRIQLGEIDRRRGALDSAYAVLSETLTEATARMGNQHPLLGRSQNALGTVHLVRGEYAPALESFEKARAIYQAAYGEQHPETARVYHQIGVTYFYQQQRDAALEALHKALAIRTAVLGNHHFDLAVTNLYIGSVHAQFGELESALEYYRQSLAIYRGTVGEVHPDAAWAINNLGYVYWAMRDFENALAYYQKALDIRRLLLPENHYDIGSSYLNIGNIYLEEGDYQTAKDHYERALSIYLAAFGETHPYTALVYSNLGIVYWRLSDYANAHRYNDTALNIRLALAGEHHPTVADSYNNIANVYRYEDKFPEALAFYRKALDIFLSAYGASHQYSALAYYNLGDVYREMGEADSALAYFQQSLTIQKDLAGLNPGGTAEVLQGIAGVYDLRGQYREALQSCQASIQAILPQFSGNDIYINPPLQPTLSGPALLVSLQMKADIFRKRYRQTRDLRDLQAAFAAIETADSLVEQMRQGYDVDASKLALGKEARGLYEQAIATGIQLYRLTGDTEYRSAAFQFSEKAKSAVLSGALRESRARKFAGIPDSLLQQEKQLRVSLAYYETRVQQAAEAAGGAESGEYLQIKDRLFELQDQYNRLVTHYETDFPAYYQLKYQVRYAGFEEIVLKMDPQSAMLEYFLGDSAIYIFVVTANGLQVIDFKRPDQFEGQVKALFSAIKKLDGRQFRQLSHELYQRLIRPVAAEIAGRKKLIIIPDGILYYLPFEVLIAAPGEPGAPPNDFSRLNYLLKDYEISYHNSATLFLEGAGPADIPAEGVSFLGFAPVFDDEAAAAEGSGAAEMFAQAAADTALREIVIDGTRFSTLKHSAREVQAITALFRNRDKTSRSYLHRDASEENFKVAAGKYHFIHIATHGILNEDQPGLSGLVFYPPGITGGAEDGVFYAGESYHLDLQCDLLVLSSCESGIGKLVKGEGMLALTRGFRYAGARNMVVSLWKVFDKQTSDLMVEFYRLILSGKGYAGALREAKLKMIADPRSAAPKKWGGFVLVGR